MISENKFKLIQNNITKKTIKFSSETEPASEVTVLSFADASLPEDELGQP